MLKFTAGVAKPIPFQLEVEGDVVELFFTALTVADSMRVGAIQSKYIADKDNTESILLAELVTCVKTVDGEYYWDEDIEKLRGVFSGEMLFQMFAQCKLVNPKATEGEGLAGKKK